MSEPGTPTDAVTALAAALERANRLEHERDQALDKVEALIHERDKYQDFQQRIAYLADMHGWNGVSNSKILSEFVASEFGQFKRLRYVARCAEALLREVDDGDGDTVEEACGALGAAIERLNAGEPETEAKQP